MSPSAPPSVVVTLGVANTATYPIDFDLLRNALEVAGGIKDQKTYRADFVTMEVTADSATVVRVHLSSADEVKLYEVKRLMVGAFDSKEEAAERFGGAAAGGVVVTGAPFYVGLTPPPPPPPTLHIFFTVKNTDVVSAEQMGELTGTLAERLSPPLSGNEDSRLTAEVISKTQITVRVVASGLDIFAMYMTLRPLMDRLGKTNDLIQGFDFQAVPTYGGFTYPPPSPPPPSPPLEPPMGGASASEKVSEVETEASGSSIGSALLGLGIIFFLISACIGVYLVKSKRYADKEIDEGRMQPFAWFWSQARADADIKAEDEEMEEADHQELESGLPRESWPKGMKGSLQSDDDNLGFGARPEDSAYGQAKAAAAAVPLLASAAATHQPAASYPPTSPSKAKEGKPTVSDLSLDDIEVAAGAFVSAPAATKSVELVRTPIGLGLTVDSQHKVLAIAKDGQAMRSGRIAVGDQLVSINDVPLGGGSSFDEQLGAIAVGTKVRLVSTKPADSAKTSMDETDPAIDAAATAAAALAAAELAGSAPTGGAVAKADTDPYDPYESEVVAVTKSEDPYETENEELSGPTSKSASQDVTPGGETDDDEEALVRRIAWIEYYVSKGDLEKARELGWSGDMSFLGLNDDGTPMDDPEEGGDNQAEGGGEAGLAREDPSMHRI